MSDSGQVLSETDGHPEPPPAPQRRRLPRSLIGVMAAVFAIATVVAHTAAIVLATDGSFDLATWYGYAAIVASAGGFLLGVLAGILNRGRGIGIIAAVVSLGANPFILLQLLNFFGGR